MWQPRAAYRQMLLLRWRILGSSSELRLAKEDFFPGGSSLFCQANSWLVRHDLTALVRFNIDLFRSVRELDAPLSFWGFAATKL